MSNYKDGSAEYDDDSEMPFGKYGPSGLSPGAPLKEIPAHYFLWLYKQNDFVSKNQGLAGWIEANMERLTAEKKEADRIYFEEKNRAAKDLTGGVVNFDED